MNETERRESRRYQVRDGTVAFAHPTDGARRLQADILNVSHKGLLVRIPPAAIDDWPALRTQLRIEARVAGETLRCGVEVAWLGGQRAVGIRQYRAGLEFIALSPAARATLTRALDALEDG